MRIWLFSLLFLSSAALFAEDNLSTPGSIHISYFHPHFKAEKLLIDSQVMFTLSTEMEKALKHNIPLTFDIEFKVFEENKLFGFNYQSTFKTVHYQIKVSYFNYSHQFIISNQRSQASQMFNSLEDAMRTFGTIRNFELINLADLSTDKEYSIAFKVSFNRWKLPTALIIDSLTNENWYLASDWREMTINRDLCINGCTN